MTVALGYTHAYMQLLQTLFSESSSPKSDETEKARSVLLSKYAELGKFYSSLIVCPLCYFWVKSRSLGFHK